MQAKWRANSALGAEAGCFLLVHTSLRAVRAIDGGPIGPIKALQSVLSRTGTLAIPSWTEDDDEPFDPVTTPAACNARDSRLKSSELGLTLYSTANIGIAYSASLGGPKVKLLEEIGDCVASNSER